MHGRVLAFLAIAAVACFVTASAQAGGVQPTKGQSAEQTQKDVAECQALAAQSSGFDPSAAPAPVASAPPQVGGRAKGAVVAGAAGAAAAEVRGQQRGGQAYDQASDEAKQEYRQNQAKSAAAAGAVVGASKQRQDRRAARAAGQQQAAETQSKAAAYDQAYQGCLLGRGYTITP